ncbi:MAG: hypothetical protein JNN08_28795 [Bryobacterales bacterium]|nr:hypothetical protein [Bryobacterales bacterium]
MRIVNLLVVLSCLTGANGQTGRQLMSGSASNGGAAFRYETRLEPAMPDLSGQFGGGGVLAGKSGIHRYVTESEGRRYFGYDLVMEPLADANQYRVTVRPLSVDAPRLGLKDPASWRQVPLPGYPVSQILRGGETMALDLLVNTATGQKIVDYIHLQDQKRLVYTAAGRARDFTAEDAELRVMDPRISVNGRPLDVSAGYSGGVSGAAVWMYIPGRGRYFLSLVPHARRGFLRAGEVRGSTIRFTTGGDQVEVDCNGAVTSGSAAYNLYVLHQPEWSPGSPESRSALLLTAADRVDLLLKK